MRRILIIDDDKAVLEATRIVLAANNYQVTTADSGKAGIEAARENPVDLIILDVFMPGMDGLTAAQAIHREHPNLPIIAISGFMFGGQCPTMPYFDDMAAEAGAISTLYKPFRPPELLQAIEKALSVPAAE
jgi:CheY-like chemotaxis protein